MKLFPVTIVAHLAIGALEFCVCVSGLEVRLVLSEVNAMVLHSLCSIV